MANQILNATTAGVNPATYAGQARPDKGDTDVWAAAIARTGVVSGCSVTQHANSNVPILRTTARVTGESQSSAITIPAAVVTGDMMVIAVDVEGGTLPTTPAGWTRLATGATSSGGQVQAVVYWKIAVSGDTGGAVSVSFATVSYTGHIILEAWYSAAGACTIDAVGNTASTSVGPPATSASVTPSNANCRVTQFWFGRASAAGQGFTLPTTVDVSSLQTSNINFSGATSQANTSGTTVVQSAPLFSVSGTPQWATYTVSIAPPAPLAGMSIDVNAGSVLIAGATVTVPALNNITVAAADATNPRIDVVTVDSTGVPIVTTGAAATTPNWPAVASLAASTAVCLGIVYVQATAASILNANIVDKREVLGVIHAEAERLFLAQLSPARRGINAGLGQVPRPAVLYPGRIAARSTFR